MENKSREIKTISYELKQRNLAVKKTFLISPSMKRITFTSPDLVDFKSMSPDDHVKLFFPYPGESTIIAPVLTARGPVHQPHSRPPIMRDYTPRRYDQQALELDIDFHIHDKGPASQWALHAQVGDALLMGGPRGSRVVPYAFDWYLMIGDEAAIPSFARRLEEMPADSHACVFVEVKDHHQKIEFKHVCQAQIIWVYRQEHEPGNSQWLCDELVKFALPAGDFFTWIGLEKSCTRDVKDLLLTIKGAREEWIKATGYWQK